MDPKTPNNLPTNQDLSYQVMPQDGLSGNYTPPTPAAPKAPPAPVASSTTAGSTPPPPSSHEPLSYEPEPSFFRTWKFYAIIGVAAALILGVAGWFLFGSEKPGGEDEPDVTRLPKVWLKQYFDKEVCDDQEICGDEADPDSDGLKNYDEFKTGTSPVNNDSDQDGLADGDEVFIFKTEATLKYTDRRDIVAQNNWLDGLQIKNGYDPLTPGLKFTDLRNKQIADDKERLKFHEPTITTLAGAGSNRIDTSTWKTWTNNMKHFVIKLPNDWKASQADSGGMSIVSIYSPERDSNPEIKIEIQSTSANGLKLTPKFSDKDSNIDLIKAIIATYIENPSAEQTQSAQVIP